MAGLQKYEYSEKQNTDPEWKEDKPKKWEIGEQSRLSSCRMKINIWRQRFKKLKIME